MEIMDSTIRNLVSENRRITKKMRSLDESLESSTQSYDMFTFTEKERIKKVCGFIFIFFSQTK